MGYGGGGGGGGSKSSHWCCACGQMSAKQEVWIGHDFSILVLRKMIWLFKLRKCNAEVSGITFLSGTLKVKIFEGQLTLKSMGARQPGLGCTNVN